MKVSLRVKDFSDRPRDAVLRRLAGAGGRWPAADEAQGMARQARATGGTRVPPPPRKPPAEAVVATAEAKAAEAKEV